MFDTNVLVSALRSRLGASYRLVSLIDSGSFKLHVSVPLVFEYEAVLKREKSHFGLTSDEIDDFLDYLCAVAKKSDIFYLWRPCLKDPADDFILELAVESGCSYIVTHNKGDFEQCRQFGIHAVNPGEFLKIIGGIL